MVGGGANGGRDGLAAAPIYELRRYGDADGLADAAAARIAGLLRAALRARGRATLALSGGATPQRAYAKLAKAELDWSRVSVTLVDDLWASGADPRSNRALLDLTLLLEGPAKAAQVTPLFTGDATPEAGAETAEAAMRRLIRPFDLVVLGLGRDGHTGCLFPQGDRLAEALDPSGRRLVTPMRAPGEEPRLGLTLGAMLESRRILLLFSGPEKARTFRRALNPGPVEEAPVRAVLRQRRAPVEVLTADQDSAEPKDPVALAWKGVEAARDRLAGRRVAEMFETDPRRFEALSASLDDLLLDLSKTGLDAAALAALVDLAEAADLPARREAMFAGEPINETEGRAVLHVALRGEAEDGFATGGEDVMAEVLETRARCLAFAEAVRTGEAAAVDGGAFADVVNIGIGGSDLGPAMVAEALAPDMDGPRLHFVSNVDGAHVHDVLKRLDPARTLVLVASKSFTTVETMTNAETARRWMAEAMGERAGAHFAAISTALDAVAAFGIAEDRVFGFRDWVGGRYSVWSAIGLSLMIGMGAERWRRFLAGARDMDRHFRAAPPAENLPVLLGLAGIWHRGAQGHATRALLPYDQRLARFPAYVQQLDMESNGKTARLRPGLAGDTGPVVWGEPGTNGQHAFFQLLHQGSTVVPCEFVAAAEGREPGLAHHHRLLLANCLAQSEALMRGRTEAEAEARMIEAGTPPERAAWLAPHRAFPGNRPSITILHRRLDPHAMGRLIALYEHRVFVEAAIWGINAFDQWGVELGKELARSLAPVLEGEAAASPGSAGLVDWIARRGG